ncbi:hypothetical protein B566_EDAN016638 [Ephemera danica]|nr:hypothetical protein B566_EDAN016638 [Ephemera danica]
MSIKAFDCIPVIQAVHSDAKSQTKIVCIECCGKELFVGSSDGSIIQYVLEEQALPLGKMEYTSSKIQEQQLNVKKPIKIIKAASALNRLLVLCNSCLFLLDMQTLEVIGGGPKLQGLSTFCVNFDPNIDDPFAIQICVSEKKKLKIINVTDKRIFMVAEIAVSDIAKEIAVDGPFICIAFPKQYKVYNFETKSSQELFQFDGESFVPIIRRIFKGEFLLTAPEGLGMFVTAEGVSSRPPIQWSCQVSSDYTKSGILALAYFHPYVLGLGSEFIMIHSILDQQQKQSLPFSGGVAVGNFDGRLYISSQSSIYCLCPIPWEQQVEVLLSDNRVDEALDLAQNSNHAGFTRDQYEQLYKSFQKQAAFIYFSMEEFEKARAMFISSDVDIREVISLFPSLLPQDSNFTRSVPPLHKIADVEQLFHRNATKLKQANMFLQQLLEEIRNISPRLLHQFEIDTALIKLYSQSDPGDLEAFIAAGEINCDLKDCLSWLQKYNCHHAMALLYRHYQNYEMAFQICTKDVDLLWRYADFILKQDQLKGVQIFTNRFHNELDSDKLKQEVILEFLQHYPQALMLYLEHLVLEKEVMKENLHTQLALLYLENILKMKKKCVDENSIAEARKKFQFLLQESSIYRVHLLLGKLKGTDLDQETATLYGKIGEHDKALDILVHRLRDYKAAETYCEINTQGRSSSSKPNLFQSLFSCYLNPSLESERREELIGPALELLNKHAFLFDTTKVLEILPPEWSITIVSSFLQGALRASVHQYRMRKVESALARGENLQRRFALYDLQRNSILMQKNNYCCVCKKAFSDGSFARFPNNVITHVACAKQNNVCPLTGKCFKEAFSS